METPEVKYGLCFGGFLFDRNGHTAKVHILMHNLKNHLKKGSVSQYLRGGLIHPNHTIMRRLFLGLFFAMAMGVYSHHIKTIRSNDRLEEHTTTIEECPVSKEMSNAANLNPFGVEKFYLINAENNSRITELKSGEIVYVYDLPTALISVEAELEGEVGSVHFLLEGSTNHQQVENVRPYALFGDIAGDFDGLELLSGEYRLVATPYTGKNAKGERGDSAEIHFTIRTNPNTFVTRFELINAEADAYLPRGYLNDRIYMSELPTTHLSLWVDTAGDPGSVHFEIEGPIIYSRVENVPPFTLFGDENGEVYGRDFVPGLYTIRATPFDKSNAQGVPGKALTVEMELVRDPDLAVLGFNYVDGYTGQLGRKLADGDKLMYDYNQEHNIRASATPDVQSVLFELKGEQSDQAKTYTYQRTENYVPYALFGDEDGDYFFQALELGNYTLTATPYSEDNLGGMAGDPRSLSFSVEFLGPIAQPDSDVSIAPNPVTVPFVQASFESPVEVVQAEVFDLGGKRILNVSETGIVRNGNIYEVDIQMLRQGVYVLVMTDRNGNTYKKKLLVGWK